MGKESTIGYLNHRLRTFSDGGVEQNSHLKRDNYGMWLRKKSNGSMYRLAQTL